jgi:hypothetical protein
MTIDSSWLTSFKEDLPHAFTRKPPFHPTAAFIDGQIRLMQGPQAEPQTWDDFIYRQFTRHLTKFFEMCDTVILAFDNYEHVPRAKCMTQVKRRKNIPILPFSAQSELPCMVPEGDRWTQCIANRTFKTKVIDLVLLRLPGILLQDRPKRRLIVDYHQPVEYSFDPQTSMVTADPIEDLPAMGEADLKFTRFATRWGKLLVDSIDGDSIPIALMHYEQELRRDTPPPLIAIYRLELRLPGEPSKRKADGSRGGGRTYEYVNIHALYAGIKDIIAQSTGRIRLSTHVGREMAMLISLIALTGTDFSRHLPQMSGKSVYAWLPDIWPALAMAFDPHEACLRTPAALDLVALLYKTKFPKHAHADTVGLPAVLDELQASKIGPRIKESLPSTERVACTIRNANWILAYWTCEPAPDPIQPTYGFKLLANGCAEYDDRTLLSIV